MPEVDTMQQKVEQLDADEADEKRKLVQFREDVKRERDATQQRYHATLAASAKQREERVKAADAAQVELKRCETHEQKLRDDVARAERMNYAPTSITAIRQRLKIAEAATDAARIAWNKAATVRAGDNF